MSLAIAPSPTNQKLSKQMCSALILFSADATLMRSVESFINLDTQTIDWDEILKIPFESGHDAAVSWAYGIWTNKIRPGANLLDDSFSMSAELQVAVLQSLAKRWGSPRTATAAG